MFSEKHDFNEQLITKKRYISKDYGYIYMRLIIFNLCDVNVINYRGLNVLEFLILQLFF